jgi:hypothetical protein
MVSSELVDTWLTELTELLRRKDLTKLWRVTFETLATEHMHGRDVISILQK